MCQSKAHRNPARSCGLCTGLLIGDQVRVLVVSVVLFSWTKNLASLFTKVYTISLQIGYLLLGESCDPRGQLLYKHDRDAC